MVGGGVSNSIPSPPQSARVSFCFVTLYLIYHTILKSSLLSGIFDNCTVAIYVMCSILIS